MTLGRTGILRSAGAVIALLVCARLAAAAPVCRVELGHGRIVLHGPDADAPPILQGLRYVACDDQGPVFETRGAAVNEDGDLVFSLAGPGAKDARVTARPTRLPHGFSLDWRIAYSGAPHHWNAASSGFRLRFGPSIMGIATRPVTKWVEPTGAHKWEQPGDTPYPDTECQLREVFFGDTALVMVSPTYDPDWIYGNNEARARFWPFAPPNQAPATAETRTTFLVVPADDLDPARLAAEAADRPLALGIASDRFANLFGPGEPVSLRCSVSNVTDRAQACKLTLDAWSYQGEHVLSEQCDIDLKPFARRVLSRTIEPRLHGVVFVAARLAWEGGATVQRATVGILPERKASRTLPGSPFGMAAVIANPEAYPDQYDLATVLPLMERIGVRWIRGGWFPLKSDTSPADEQRVRSQVELLHKHGILPHVQLGSLVPKSEELDDFKRRLAECLERFKWVSPYIEVGNELNFSTSGADYVNNMLRPINEVMRHVYPEGKVMSMGLGGVHKQWLDGFVAAGGMELIDVLSVHPGAHPRAPEFWQGWRGWVFRPQMLDAMKAARDHGGKDVWITEAYAPTPPHRSAIDLRSAADYLVRTYVISIALGVKVIEWYQFQDGVWFAQRPRPDDVEYNFGIVYSDLTPKPAYIAFGAMTEQLEGAACQGRLVLGAADTYGVRFVKDGAPLDVLWSYREKHETDLAWWPPEEYKDRSRRPGEPWQARWRRPVAVELPADGVVTVTDIMGNAREVQPHNGKVRLQLTGSPIYVRGLGDIRRVQHFWPEAP